MKYYNYYRHLDKDTGPCPFDMDQIAEWAANQNYGAYRLVCAIIRAQYGKNPKSKLAGALKEVVDKYTA